MTVCGREGGAEMNEWKINYISSLYEARLYTVAVQYTHTHTVSTVFFSRCDGGRLVEIFSIPFGMDRAHNFSLNTEWTANETIRDVYRVVGLLVMPREI